MTSDMEETWKDTFKAIDKDNSGYLTLSELDHALEALGHDKKLAHAKAKVIKAQ